MSVAIRDIAVYLPEIKIVNEDLKNKNPDWIIDQVQPRSGVEERYIAGDDETALDLSLKASKILFSEHETLPQVIDGLIFCTQSPDYILPSNSSVLHKELNLSDDVFAFDINLACSVYIYGLALAQGLI